MSSKIFSFVLIISLSASVQLCQGSVDSKADSTEDDFFLQVYLPREVAIKDDTARLGQVSILRGRQSLVAKASEIALGRISVPGQKIIIDRAMVLSRLACNGIAASKVKLSGAEKITVEQQQRIIKGSEFIELASSFLEENPPAGSVCQLNPIRIPKDLVVPGAGKDIKLSPRLVRSGARNRAKVQIIVLSDGKEAGKREVTFRLKYNCRRAVTVVEIDAGGVISPENVKIEDTISNYPEPGNWTAPYGLIAKRRLAANTVVGPHTVGLREPEVIIKRNQTVLIRIERPGILVTAIGKSMQEGGAGEYIKVRNIDSQRIILAKVNEDGTVEPTF